jgi:ATP diphosphatase
MDVILEKAMDSMDKAEKFGFVWSDHRALLAAVQSEFQEIEESITQKESPERLVEEIGDLLLGCMEICRYFSVSPTLALTQAESKFSKRFEKVVEITTREGKRDLTKESFEKKLAVWKEAKKEVYLGEAKVSH